MSEHQLHSLAKDVAHDLYVLQGKLGEMLRQIGELPVEESTAGSFMNGPVTARCCPSCGCGSPSHTADCEQADAA